MQSFVLCRKLRNVAMLSHLQGDRGLSDTGHSDSWRVAYKADIMGNALICAMQSTT